MLAYAGLDGIESNVNCDSERECEMIKRIFFLRLPLAGKVNYFCKSSIGQSAKPLARGWQLKVPPWHSSMHINSSTKVPSVPKLSHTSHKRNHHRDTSTV